VVEELRDVLAGQTDPAGRRFEIVDLPAPETLADDDGSSTGAT
jgi:agmatine deiminase